MIRNLDEACRELRERWLIIVVSYLMQAVCLVINITFEGWIFGLSAVVVSHLFGWSVAYAICGREGAE